MKLISLIFSFKNEEKNLDELVKRVHNTISYEILCRINNNIEKRTI